jgi:GalNAc-alpha-(1->4)-GalNAc-alpha-(1->3)-diNAcBac-PP-undecaprenol alpha-1,4-N-acetyl-D-galactosaminyltransferase
VERQPVVRHGHSQGHSVGNCRRGRQRVGRRWWTKRLGTRRFLLQIGHLLGQPTVAVATRRERRGTIVHAVPDFEPAVGGTTRQVGLQARALQGRGYDVVVVTRRRSASWPRAETLDGLSVVRLGLPGSGHARDLHALLALAVWLARRRRRITVVQTVMWPDAYASAALAGLLGRTVVVWAIRTEIARTLAGRSSPAARLVRRLRRRLLRRCVHVALTDSMAAELDCFPGPWSRAVIPVPVDVRHFRPPSPHERRTARAELGLETATFVAVYVGHLEARKAVDRLVEAVALLERDSVSVRLLLVGGGRGPGDTHHALRNQVAEAGLGGSVSFCGVAADPRPYLWAADALVLASVLEGMPNSLLEGMACGLPCVAPASAGGDELLDAETGVVPPSNDPDELAAALRALATDPRRRQQLGQAAAASVRRFSVDAVADRYEELYEDLSGGAGS